MICAMAPTHAASDPVSLFCKKVIISQRDEILLMQNWLRDRAERVPDPNDTHPRDTVNMRMDEGLIPMPGMLTAAQLKQLDGARGTTWDTLFLADMIRNHQGALTMVATLFDSPSAAQTPEIFGYATDVDQRAEIERMEGMLSSLQRRTPHEE
ncbi:MAG TPA: DUF305 domain-containing protein [Gemmatimonadaceae bacterium]|nr:DUF305 domain-containing protein [Gemmatimonadaceae bacterium]